MHLRFLSRYVGQGSFPGPFRREYDVKMDCNHGDGIGYENLPPKVESSPTVLAKAAHLTEYFVL